MVAVSTPLPVDEDYDRGSKFAHYRSVPKLALEPHGHIRLADLYEGMAALPADDDERPPPP